MPPQVVEVAVPDGVTAGDEFLIEYEGQQLAISCPDGCGAGDLINIEVDVPEAAGSSLQQVEVTVPDGCFPGMEFTVEFDGSSFNITVPDGCSPGDPILVDVPETPPPPDETATSAAERDQALAKRAQDDGPAGTWACRACTYLNEPHRRSCDVCGTPRTPAAEMSAQERRAQEKRDADLARSLQGEEVRQSANADNFSAAEASSRQGGSSGSGFGAGSSSGFGGGGGGSSSDSTDSSQPASLFSMSVGTDDGTFGRPAGEFYIGQLVQVTRSDGSWTYGKIISYDSGGDTYSVMTKMGPKHFVERADLTDDVVVNPSDGGCAHQ